MLRKTGEKKREKQNVSAKAGKKTFKSVFVCSVHLSLLIEEVRIQNYVVAFFPLFSLQASDAAPRFLPR